MSVGAFYTVLMSMEYGMPLAQSVMSIAPHVDTVSILLDPRSGEETKSTVAGLANSMPNIQVTESECPLDGGNPLGEWKTEARRTLDTDWVVECDPCWVFACDREYLRRATSSAPRGGVCIAFGSVNLFNGSNLKDEHPDRLPILSRNHPDITHSDSARDGCGLAWPGGGGIRASVSLPKRKKPGRRVGQHPAWVFNYEWYSLPLQYEYKQLMHYVKGRRSGRYRDIDSYTVDLDGNLVELFGFVVRLPVEMYPHEIRDEMLNPTVRRVSVTHPESMGEWIQGERTKEVRFRLARRALRAASKLKGRTARESIG